MDSAHAYSRLLDVELSPLQQELLEAFLETLASQGSIYSPTGRNDLDGDAVVVRSQLQIELILRSLSPFLGKQQAKALL